MAEIIGQKLRALLNVLKGPQFEKSIPYMYVDTVGKITVGVGHNLSIHKDLLRLHFVVARFERHAVSGGDRGIPITENKIVGRHATASEKQNDFDFLSRHRALGHYAPEHLEKYTTLALRPQDIDKLFESDLVAAVKIARHEFGADFDKFSVQRQAAIVDIAFNTGSFRTFQHSFVPAIKGHGEYAKKSEAERWKEAAKHSRRGKVQGSRNAKVAEWLNNGVNVGVGF
jgi:GH24 family phage-related lysozyme (muramidase)